MPGVGLIAIGDVSLHQAHADLKARHPVFQVADVLGNRLNQFRDLQQNAHNDGCLQDARTNHPAGQVGFRLGNVALHFKPQDFDGVLQVVLVFGDFGLGRHLSIKDFGQCTGLGLGLLGAESG